MMTLSFTPHTNISADEFPSDRKYYLFHYWSFVEKTSVKQEYILKWAHIWQMDSPQTDPTQLIDPKCTEPYYTKQV